MQGKTTLRSKTVSVKKFKQRTSKYFVFSKKKKCTISLRPRFSKHGYTPDDWGWGFGHKGNKKRFFLFCSQSKIKHILL